MSINPRRSSRCSRTAGVGLVLLWRFIAHSRRHREDALIPASLFERRGVRASATLAAVFGATTWGALFLLPLFFQIARGASPLHAGLLMAPQGLGAALALPISGRVTDRRGPRRMVFVGTILLLIGTLPFVLQDRSTSGGLLLVALFIRGVGIGAASVQANAAAYQLLERDQISQATTAMGVINRLGASFGTSLAALLINHGLAGALGPAAARPGDNGQLLAQAMAAHGRLEDPLARAFAWPFAAMRLLALVAMATALRLPSWRPGPPQRRLQ